MLAKIKKFEQTASILEPNNKQRQHLAQQVEDYAGSFLQELPKAKTFERDPINHKKYNELSIHDKPISLEAILALIKRYVVEPGLNVTSPGFLGYIPGGSLYSSALGDYIAAITNRFAGAFYVSPGAARLENILIRWMCNLVGYPKTAGGNLSSGGSLANFIAIVTARQAFDLKSNDFCRTVIYVSSQVHHSIIKALRIAGLGEAIIRFIPVDENYCLKSQILKQMIEADKKQKLIPWLIVATFGTTNTGSIDPIAEISQIAQRNKIWLHIDAAYGGFFILCRKIKNSIKNMNSADSITIDPHKGLFIPYGLGVIITKEWRSLLEAYYYDDVDYLPHTDEEENALSSAELSPELSKHFRALRLWLPLKLYGLAPFKAALNEKLLLTQYFYNKLRAFNNVEIACKPQLSIVAFRYCPKQGDINYFNQLLYEKIKLEGKVFFSTTYLKHHFFLRMACLNFRTHLDTIEVAIDVLQHSIKALLQK